jgi:hypothetical protein
VLEAMQRGVQRALLDAQDVLGELPDAARDGPAVQRLQGQRLQDQEVERSLHQIDGFQRALPMMIDNSGGQHRPGSCR